MGLPASFGIAKIRWVKGSKASPRATPEVFGSFFLQGDEATEADHLAFAFFEPDDDWPESDFRGAAEAKEVVMFASAFSYKNLSDKV